MNVITIDSIIIKCERTFSYVKVLFNGTIMTTPFNDRSTRVHVSYILYRYNDIRCTLKKEYIKCPIREEGGGGGIFCEEHHFLFSLRNHIEEHIFKAFFLSLQDYMMNTDL